jgi:hypothetical protein
MKISIACPASIHANQSALNALTGAEVTVEGALLHFHILDEQPLALIRKWDEELGLAIAEETDAELIRAMSHLKSAVLDVERVAQRESSYSSREENYLTRAADELAAEVTEATVDSDASQLHAEQHTSIDESSEQHGVAPLNEEIGIEQANEKEPGSGFFGQRARADRS